MCSRGTVCGAGAEGRVEVVAADVVQSDREDVQVGDGARPVRTGRVQHRVLGDGEVPVHPQVGLHQPDRCIHPAPPFPAVVGQAALA